MGVAQPAAIPPAAGGWHVRFLMSIIRCQVRFQGRSNIPEDVFVNTFHFDFGLNSLNQAKADTMTNALNAFYDVIPPGGVASIANRLSTFVNVPVSVRWYNLDDEKPRIPVTTAFTLETRQIAGTNLPEEVAVVASFSGGPPITPRRRGRIYIGPLQGTAVNSSSPDTRVRVVDAFMADISKCCMALVADSAAQGCPWVVWSPTGNVATEIERGHIDNAPDTQRRRGPVALARVIWPSPA